MRSEQTMNGCAWEERGDGYAWLGDAEAVSSHGQDREVRIRGADDRLGGPAYHFKLLLRVPSDDCLRIHPPTVAATLSLVLNQLLDVPRVQRALVAAIDAGEIVPGPPPVETYREDADSQYRPAPVDPDSPEGSALIGLSMRFCDP